MIVQFKKNNGWRIFFFGLMLAISLSGQAQTIPNLYPAYWLGRQFKRLTANHLMMADTSIKPVRRFILKDSCPQRKSGKNIFINRDSLLKKRVLKAWRY